MSLLKVYDNKGQTFDRYSVLRLDWPAKQAGDSVECIGMSDRPFHPQGFGQHCAATPGDHLGDEIGWDELPDDCQKAAKHFLGPAIAAFNRFEFEMPLEAIDDCYHQGECYDDVAFWRDKIDMSHISDDDLAAELREYGAWDDDDLADREANEERIIWIAAGDFHDRYTA